MAQFNAVVPAYAQSAQYPVMSHDDRLLAQFAQVIQQHEINDDFSRRLRGLEGFEIVVIADDSGSMSTPVDNPLASPLAKSFTRWDELKKSLGVIVDVASVMDKDGLDIYFLNRGTMRGVSHSSQLDIYFAGPPGGMTPISNVLRAVLKEKAQIIREKKLLIVIATDGQPTDDRGEVDISTLKHILQSERNPIDRIFVSFLACTDDKSTMEYLNKWDKELANLDVVDDYVSERTEILKAQGKNFKFSQGDHIVKCLLGSVDKYFDNLDEKSVAQSCCVIC
jgi:hypothetical protein